jgi:hypothetical protein
MKDRTFEAGNFVIYSQLAIRRFLKVSANYDVVTGSSTFSPYSLRGGSGGHISKSKNSRKFYHERGIT